MLNRIIVCAVFGLFSQAASAQDVRPMSEFAEARAHYNNESDLACAGEEAAFQRLLTAADPEQIGDPAALAALAWLVASESCSYYTGDDEQISYFYILGAQEGYPVALAYAGVRMIRGLGVPQNANSGAGLLMLGLEGGYGDAGAMLAGELVTGLHMPRDLEAAKNLLQAAEANGADPDLLENVWSAYSAVSE